MKHKIVKVQVELTEGEIRDTADALAAGIIHKGTDPNDACPICATRGKMLQALFDCIYG